MGPSLLFDKSSLQGLSIDESVWFDRFFTTIVCPLFFVETLGDLRKEKLRDRTAEDEVRIIAEKTPQLGSCAHVFHVTLATGDLLGYPVPMDGKPMPPSSTPSMDEAGQIGVVIGESSESEALQRWIGGRFEEV